MTRRRFLTTALLFLGALGAYLAAPLRLRDLKRRIKTSRLPKLDPSSPTGILSPDEMNTIVALSAVLLPRLETLRLEDDFFPQYVNQRTASVKGYFQEYREAAKLLDETTHKVIDRRRAFADLSVPERNRVLAAILWKYHTGELLKARLALLFTSRRKLAFREFVVKDLLAAFYRSPVAWALVGYLHYPGVPAADPFEYSKPMAA